MISGSNFSSGSGQNRIWGAGSVGTENIAISTICAYNGSSTANVSDKVEISDDGTNYTQIGTFSRNKNQTAEQLYCGQSESFYDNVIRGTNSGDYLVGTSQNDLIIGGNGNDFIRGAGGNDCIYAENGSDFIQGGSGDDTIYGGTGDDTVRTGSGNDTVYGETGDDILHAVSKNGINSLDTTRPIPTIALDSSVPSQQPVSISLIPIIINYTEAITGFVASDDISVTNGILSALNASSGVNFSATVTPSVSVGTVSINVISNSVQDVSVRNNNNVAATFDFTVDSVNPTVLSAQTLSVDTILLQLSEPITTSAIPPANFVVSGATGGTPPAQVTSISQLDDDTILLTIGSATIAGTDTLTISYTNTAGTIFDVASNTLDGFAGISITNNVNSVPQITSVSSTDTDGTFIQSDTVDVTVQFTKPVTVFSDVTGLLVPTLQLETGSVDRTILFTEGNNTNTLTFQYTIQNNDASDDLQYTSINALQLPSGVTIQDSVTPATAATFVLPALTGTDSLAGNKEIVIDGTPTSVIRAELRGDNTIEISYNKAVTVTSTDYTNLIITSESTATRNITGIFGSGSSNIIITFDGAIVTIGDDATIDVTHLGINAQDVTELSNTYAFIENDSTVVITDNIPSVITIEDDTTSNDPVLDFSALGAGSTLQTPASLIIANLDHDADNTDDAVITIPPNTTIGNLDATTQNIDLSVSVQTPTLPTGTVLADSVIVELGDPNREITFDNAIQIDLPGLAGNTGFFIDASGITSVVVSCNVNHSLVSGGIASELLSAEVELRTRNITECSVDAGSALRFYTLHFSSWGAFGSIPTTTPTTTPTTPTPSSSGGGGGGGGGSSRILDNGSVLESDQSVVLYEVYWDTNADDGSKLLSIIAAPDSDAVSVKLRTPESGLVYTQRAELQPYHDGDRVLYEAILKSSDDFAVVYVEAISHRAMDSVQHLIQLKQPSGDVIITEYVQQQDDDDVSAIDDDTLQEKITDKQNHIQTVAPINTPQIITSDFLESLYVEGYDGISISYDYLTLQTVYDNYAKMYHQINDQSSTTIGAINLQTGYLEMILQVSHTEKMVNSARAVYLGDDDYVDIYIGEEQQLRLDSAPLSQNIVLANNTSNVMMMVYSQMNLASVISSNDLLEGVMSNVSISNDDAAKQINQYTILQKSQNGTYGIIAAPDIEYGGDDNDNDNDGANGDLNMILVIYGNPDGSDLSIRAAHIGGDSVSILFNNGMIQHSKSMEIPPYDVMNAEINNTDIIITSCGAGKLLLDNGVCMDPEPVTFVCSDGDVMKENNTCIGVINSLNLENNNNR